jgi:hypothetical protein
MLGKAMERDGGSQQRERRIAICVEFMKKAGCRYRLQLCGMAYQKEMPLQRRLRSSLRLGEK